MNIGKKIVNTDSTQDIIFEILSDNFPLSIAEINRKIKTSFGLKITYQAVRKAVSKMLELGVLTRDPTKQLLIDKKWLLAAKHKIDKLIHIYEDPAIATKTEPSIQLGDYSTYHLNSLFELDKFWSNLVLEHCPSLPPDTTLSYLSIGYYAWWLPFNFGSETKFWRAMIRRGYKCEMHLLRKLPLNTWAAGIYKSIGMKAKVFEDKGHDRKLNYNLINDLAIQVYIPDSALKVIEQIFEKTKKIEQLDHKKLDKMAHMRHDYRLTLIKDKNFVNNIALAYGKNSRN